MLNKSIFFFVIALYWAIPRTSAQAVADNHKARYGLLQPYTPTGILIDRSPLNLIFRDSTSIGFTTAGQSAGGSLLRYESLYKLFYHASFSGHPFIRSPEDLPFLIDSSRNGVLSTGWPQILSHAPIAEVVMGSLALNYNRIALDAFQGGYIYLDTSIEKYKLRLSSYQIQDTVWLSGVPGTGAFSIQSFNVNPNTLQTLDNWKSTEQLIYFSALQKSAYTGQNGIVRFSFPSFLNLTNVPGCLMEVDLDDGNGYQIVSTNGLLTATYDSGGIKRIKARFRNSKGALVSEMDMFTELEVVKARYQADGVFISKLVSGCDIDNREGNGEAVLSFKYAPQSGGKLRKPFILIEGFESSEFDKNNSELDIPQGGGFGAFNWYSITSGTPSIHFPQMEMMGIVMDSLLEIGYDVGFVDFRTNRAVIEKNANALISLLEQVRDELILNKSQQGIQLMGVSMGGLIARCALVKMEKSSCCHAVKTYFTFSTPHRGANIPVSAQYLTYDLGYRYNLLGLGDRAKLTYLRVLNSPAARQMLVNHIDPTAHTVHTGFYQKLDTLGHPGNSKKIAITDGSLNGFLHREKNHDLNSPVLSELQHLFSFQVKVVVPTKVITYLEFPPKKFNLILANGRAIEHSINAISPHWVYQHGPDILENIGDVLDQNLLWSKSASELAMIVAFHELAKLAFPLYVVPITAAQVVISGRSIYRNEVRLQQGYAQHHNSQNIGSFYLTKPSEGWDNAPGDFNSTISEMAEEAGEILGQNPFTTVFNTHTFVSSKSALDEPTGSRIPLFDHQINNVVSSRFDYIWAKKQPLKYDFLNRPHVDVNFEFLKWLTGCLMTLESRFYLKDNTVLNTDYNAAPPANGLINQQGHYFEFEFIPSLRIRKGVILSLNRMLFPGPVGSASALNLLPKPHGEAVFKTRSLSCEPVTVKNEGTLVLGESMTTGFRNQAHMQFNGTSTLELFPYSILRIQQGSKLTIQRGATLIIHPNAQIVLEGDNAVLEIKGKVVLMPNAVFTFSGLGYVQIDQDSLQAGNTEELWQTSGQAAILFRGTYAQQKLVEFKSNLMLNPNIKLHLELGEARIKSGVVLDIYGPLVLDKMHLSLLNGSGYHSGIYLHGQGGISIRHSRFSRGAPALTANMIQGRNPLYLENCQFLDNVNAVITYGGQVHFKNSLFELNQIAWHGYDLDGVSEIAECSFFTNNTALEVMGQHDAQLKLSQNLIQDNVWGLRSFGQLHVRLNCNNISENYTGIYAGNYQLLLGGRARNKFTDNRIAIRIEEVDNIFLHEGENDFSGSQMYITGTFSGIAMNYLAYNPVTNSYEINIKDNRMPVVNGNTRMHLRDWNGDPVYARLYTPLPPYLPVCEKKQTTDFETYVLHNWTTKTEVSTSSGNLLLNEAILTATSYITSNDYTNAGFDLMAIDMFDEIFSDLRNRGDFSPTDQEYVMLEIALNKMLEAHNNAYRLELLPRVRASGGFQENEKLEKVISELNFRIEQVFYGGYPEKVHYSLILAKAQAYRTAEYYDYALESLYELKHTGDDYWQGIAAYWICICEAERQLIWETISPEVFEELRRACISLAPELRKGEPEMIGDTMREQSKEASFTVYPNPATAYVVVKSAIASGEASLIMTDLTGRIVNHFQWPDFGDVLLINTNELAPGVYLLRINAQHTTETIRFVKQ